LADNFKNYEPFEGSLSTPAAIYALFDITVEFHAGRAVYEMKRTLVRKYVRQITRKILAIEDLKICTSTFVMYDVRRISLKNI
jgi:hypothetical protein